MCNENPVLIETVSKYCDTFDLDRSSLFVTTLRGQKVFVTRFLTPQRPPVELGKSPKILCRFTSLIPFVQDWITTENTKKNIDIWCTSQEFLDIKAGDWEEHAILLCNYFLYTERSSESYIVFGSAVPEGNGIYVLRVETNDIITLYNASNGQIYDLSSDDISCPVKRISMVVSKDNVYANVQKKMPLSQLNFKILGNTNCWKPLFSKNFSHSSIVTSGVVQSEKLVYYPKTPRDTIVSLETNLNETLKIHIRRWRSKRYTTSFHADCSYKLKKLCMLLEELESGKTELTQRMHDEVISLNGFKIFGTPINMTYTTPEVLIDAIENTNIHWNEHPDAQFALGVYIHPYPNDILSVWVYFCSLTPL